MARRRYRIFRIFGRSLLGFISFILLVTLGFYMSRGWIMQRAVDYVNDRQQGEIRMGRMNLIPLMHFPDVSLQLRNIGLYEEKIHPDSLYQEPILSLDEVYLSLDVVELIRGNIRVSRASLGNGFIRYLVYEDSVSNIEKALAGLIGEGDPSDTAEGYPDIRIDLDRLRFSNVTTILEDRSSGMQGRATVNRLENTFHYLPDLVESQLQLSVELTEFNYQKYKLDRSRDVELTSQLKVELEKGRVELQPSSLRVSGFGFEAWGELRYGMDPFMDISFRASNEGLDLLNYLLRGILNMEEIEQIGSGSIHLNGNVSGSLGEQVPVIRVNGMADGIGFRIRSIRRDVTDISFRLYATNGMNPDLSEGKLVLKGFHATFPEGELNASITAENGKVPRVNMEVLGGVDLNGLEQMLNVPSMRDLKGVVEISGVLEGEYDLAEGELIQQKGNLNAWISGGSLIWQTDSLRSDTLQNLNGEIYLEEQILGARELGLEYNGMPVRAGITTENLLLHLLGLDREVTATIDLSSSRLLPARLTGDTMLSSMLGQEITDVRLRAGATISGTDLDQYLDSKVLPGAALTLEDVHMKSPYYAGLSGLSAALSIGPDSVVLHRMSGRIGESGFRLSGVLKNLSGLMGKDSLGQLEAKLDLSSEIIRAEDLLVYKGESLLPAEYSTEYLENFRLDGAFSFPLSGLLVDSVSLDADVEISHLGWNFRYYPQPFEDFRIRARREGDDLFIDHFEGRVGESDLQFRAHIGNTGDSLMENMYGEMSLQSDLLDFNRLMNYQLPDQVKDKEINDTAGQKEAPRLDQIDYPDFSFSLDIGEIRYGNYRLFGLNGDLRSTSDKILYLDQVGISGESGGGITFNGQFNVSNPEVYNFSSFLDLDRVNINDLDFEMSAGEETYTLKENFQGLVSAEGIAEIFITPDLQFDMSTTTAAFNVMVEDGALINFTPLQAAARYLDNTDLNYVRYSTSQSRFTLVDSSIDIALMNIESTAGQLLIEGEQGLDNSFLYLLRLPTWLVRGAARSVVSESGGDGKEDEIHRMETGRFLILTVWGEGEETEVRLGDRRDRYR